MEYSDKIINAFQDECTDLLESLEENILLLEKEPENMELINELFRIIHSLKSETALMGFNNFSNLAHKFEDVFQQLRDGNINVDEDLIELSIKILDKFKVMYNEIVTLAKDTTDTTDVLNEIQNFHSTEGERKEQQVQLKSIKISKEELQKYRTKGYKNIFNLSIKLFDNVALKYARSYLIYNNLQSAGEIVKSSVDFQTEGADEQYGNISIIILTNKIEKDIYDIIDVSEVEKISIQKITDEEEKKVEKKAEQPKEVLSNSIRVSIQKIDDLMNLAGELVVNYNSIEKFHETLTNKRFAFNKNDKSAFFEILGHFKRIIDSLQDNVMKFRMVPIKILFDKFPRLIHNISKELNKKVNLSITGEYTEVDKTVIEEIREPLTHIIRNSIDHGLEDEEERVKKGKQKAGRIRISAYQSGNNIIIEINDDGSGIDIEKIRARAVRKGLVSEKKSQTLKQNQILGFIFLPGFSTSDEITKMSGRGVGMDVVKSNIEKIQGKLIIKTKQDKGTSIIISIPLTIAITKALIVKSTNLYFAIPLYSIQETLRIYRKEIRIVDQYEVINLRGKLLSILHLNKIFQLDNIPDKIDKDNIIFLNSKKRKANRLFVIVVNYGSRNIGLIVDQLITEQDIVIKPLSEYIEQTEGVSGVTILGDGRVAYILDPISLIDFYLNQSS